MHPTGLFLLLSLSMNQLHKLHSLISAPLSIGTAVETRSFIEVFLLLLCGRSSPEAVALFLCPHFGISPDELNRNQAK